MAAFPDPIHSSITYDRYVQAYQRGTPRWDSGITPPELVAVVEGVGAMVPGTALDLGCGTGTNSLYLARHGWRVTGVDFVPAALELAGARQSAAAGLPGELRFLLGDVTRLDALGLEQDYTLLFDLGCLHSIETSDRMRYAEGIARLALPQALFLFYGFLPNEQTNNSLTYEEVEALFEPAFTIEQVVESQDRPDLRAVWYWLRRNA